MVYGKPAHNTRLTLRRPMGGSGLRKTAVGALRLCAVLSPPHFFVPVKLLRSFTGTKKRHIPPNVRRNAKLLKI